VVTVEAIARDPACTGGDLAEKIRSFLRGAHENWNTRWVLLGGHVTEVPSRGCHMRRNEHGGCGNISDVYFGDVLPKGATADTDVEIYNWNGDGDSRFGEAADGMDIEQEMYVARLPVRTPGQVKDYLRKYFDYAHGRDAACMGRALVVGAEEFRARQERLTGFLKELGKSSDYTVDSLIEVPVAKIVETMNQGYAIMDIFGHGCPHHMWLGEKRSHFGVPQIRTLCNKGKYGIVYSQGCSANDYRKWESMGVAFLTHPDGGAVAYTGYTATSFAHPINQLFYQYVFEGTCPQLGLALARAKNGIQDAWVKEYLNILGEPEMWVWTRKPSTLEVEAALTAGRPALLRVRGAGGKAVERARLLLRIGKQYLSAMSDKEGCVRLTAPEKSGKARILVIAQNHTVLETTVNVARAEGPVLRAPELLVDDDSEGGSKGNGKKDLSPDEVVDLRLSWPEVPGGGTVKLEVDDPFVEVVQGEHPAGDAEGFFRVKVKESVRPGHHVWMTVRLVQEGIDGTFWWRRVLPVQGPSLCCVRCRIDDPKGNRDGRLGWEDAGAPLGMYVTIYNRGNQPAKGLKLTLATADPAVTLEEGELGLGNLEDQDARETRTPFRLKLAPDFDGHPLAFELVMRDREGGEWKATIRIAVPPAPPILLSHVAGTSRIHLSWRPGGSPNVYGYQVYRATRSGGPYKRVTEKPVRGMTLFQDKAVKPNDDFYYVVTAVTAEGLESPPSAEHHARTLSKLWGRK
jgi:hypothetical protein